MSGEKKQVDVNALFDPNMEIGKCMPAVNNEFTVCRVSQDKFTVQANADRFKEKKDR